MIATYAIYPWYPIACEGDDPWTESLTLHTEDPEKTREELQQRLGGWIQLWEITHGG